MDIPSNPSPTSVIDSGKPEKFSYHPDQKTCSITGTTLENVTAITQADVDHAAFRKQIGEQTEHEYVEVPNFSSINNHPDDNNMSDRLSVFPYSTKSSDLTQKIIKSQIENIQKKYLPLPSEAEVLPEAIPQLTSRIQKTFELQDEINKALVESPELTKNLVDTFHQNYTETVAAKNNLHDFATIYNQITSIGNYGPSPEEKKVYPEETKTLLEKIEDIKNLKNEIATAAIKDLSSQKVRGMIDYFKTNHNTIIALKENLSPSVERQDQSNLEIHNAKKANCLSLIDFGVKEDATVLNNEEKRKLSFITSYIKKLRVHEASKLHNLKRTIQDAISKVTVQGNSLSFKKNLLNSFLIPEYDFPKNFNKIDKLNVRLLRETTIELHPDVIISALKEFEDPYLQGNQASYSKEFLLIKSLSEAQALLPKKGKFQGGVFLREECQRKTEHTILEWFQEKQLDHPYSPEVNQPLEVSSSKEFLLKLEAQKLEKEKLIYDKFLVDVSRAYMVLEEGKQSIVISDSESTLPSAGLENSQGEKTDDSVEASALSNNEGVGQTVNRSADETLVELTKLTDSKIDTLNKFKAFIGYDHQQLGIAIGRMMNQTIMADFEMIKRSKVSPPSESIEFGYPDKGFLYFQYIPSSGAQTESVSHTLTKESDTSFKITSNVYREMQFSSEEGQDDLLFQIHHQVSCRISESPNYNPSQEMTIENLPCQVEYLDFSADYQVRPT